MLLLLAEIVAFHDVFDVLSVLSVLLLLCLALSFVKVPEKLNNCLLLCSSSAKYGKHCMCERCCVHAVCAASMLNLLVLD